MRGSKRDIHWHLKECLAKCEIKSALMRNNNFSSSKSWGCWQNTTNFINGEREWDGRMCR